MSNPISKTLRRSLAPSLAGMLHVLPALANLGSGLDPLLAMSLDELMAVKVRISTNTEQPTSKAPSVVSVITEDDIRATGATNVTDVLQNLPSVYIRPNLFAYRPLATFRGASGNNILMMVNGAPIRDLVWSSGIFYKGLPASMIERVEIVRGPGSALFGSDASAGVVNVITKTAGKIAKSEAGVRVGSYDTVTGWLQHGGEWNDFDINFTAEVSRTGGHDPLIARDAQGANISYAPGAAGYGWKGADLRFSMSRGNWRLMADYWRHDDVETGLTGSGVVDPVTRGSDSRFNLALLYSNPRFTDDWGVDADIRYRNLDYSSGNGFLERPSGYNCAAAKNCNNGTVGIYPNGLINRQNSAERLLSAELGATYIGLKDHNIRFGVGGNRQDLYYAEHLVNYGKDANGIAIPLGSPLVNISGSPYAFAPTRVRHVRYAYLQDIWSFARDWDLTLGLRHDSYSDFGSALTPRAALVWQSTDRLTTKLMYGRAFRAPTYLELYSLTSATVPNPNLKPEKTKTWDLAFSYRATNDLFLNATFYYSAQTDLIAQDSALKYQNIGSGATRGYELEARWQATRTIRLSGNVSDREDLYNAFNSVPKQKAYLRADWAFLPAWNWNVQVNWIGKHELLPTDTVRSKMPSYALTDTTLRYTYSSSVELAASIRNLFDSDAREYSSSGIPNNLPMPGRNYYAEARFKF